MDHISSKQYQQYTLSIMPRYAAHCIAYLLPLALKVKRLITIQLQNGVVLDSKVGMCGDRKRRSAWRDTAKVIQGDGIVYWICRFNGLYQKT